MYTIREYLYFMEMCHMSEDPKEQGTGTWKEHGRNLDDSGNTTRQGIGNRTTRTIGIGKYLRWDLTTLGNRVGSGHPCTGLRSGCFRFLGFRVFQELQGRVRVCLRNCRDAAASLRKMQENIGNCREALGQVQNIPKISQHYFESVMGCNKQCK